MIFQQIKVGTSVIPPFRVFFVILTREKKKL